MIQKILTSDIETRMLLGNDAKRICEQVGNKSYLEVLYFALLNRAMSGDTRAANTLLKEMADAENKQPSEFASAEEIRIVVVGTKADIDSPVVYNEPQDVCGGPTGHTN